MDYLAGEDGIAARRVRAGIAGWRLDVADELSDEFLDTLRESLHAASSDEQPLIIGEVWENAADKMAYGHRRRYFSGRQLDSVMNYPVRNAILALVRDGDAETFCNVLTELYSSYPKAVSHALMNFLGTHDTERILTVLGDPNVGDERTNAELSIARLSAEQRHEALSRLKTAFTVLFTVFGVPSVFYGDEAGMEGHRDPFCRRPYPWGREEASLVEHVRLLGQLRHENACFRDGDFRILSHSEHTVAFERRSDDGAVIVAVNAGQYPWHFTPDGRYEVLVAGRCDVHGTDVAIPAGSAVVLKEVCA